MNFVFGSGRLPVLRNRPYGRFKKIYEVTR